MPAKKPAPKKSPAKKSPARRSSKRRQLSVFLQISLDGYYCDAHGDMSFAHKAPDDTEWNRFVANNAKGGGMLLFGRTTYEMMSSWWPTPMAAQAMPEVAASMNAMPKVVFSRTLKSAEWENTTLIAGDAVRAVKVLKEKPGPDMATLGSGKLVTALAAAGLIDTLQIVINPIALGGGKPVFGGLRKPLGFTLTKTKAFKNGSIVCWYAGPPAGSSAQ
jgi:dihydrofolate reductase